MCFSPCKSHHHHHVVKKCLSPCSHICTHSSYVVPEIIETNYVEPIGVSIPVKKSLIRKSFVQEKPAEILEEIFDVPKTTYESVVKKVPKTVMKTITKKVPVTTWVDVEEKVPVTNIQRVVRRSVTKPPEKRVITEDIPVTEYGLPLVEYGVNTQFYGTGLIGCDVIYPCYYDYIW